MVGRYDSIKQIFVVHGKRVDDERVALIENRTNWIDTARFFAACERLERSEALPSNIVREICMYAVDTGGGRIVAACPKCVVYVDNQPLHQQFAPGMRNYVFTDGRSGFSSPCDCESGKAIRKELDNGAEWRDSAMERVVTKERPNKPSQLWIEVEKIDNETTPKQDLPF